MKKCYIKPDAKSIAVKTESVLMAGSPSGDIDPLNSSSSAKADFDEEE